MYIIICKSNLESGLNLGNARSWSWMTIWPSVLFIPSYSFLFTFLFTLLLIKKNLVLFTNHITCYLVWGLSFGSGLNFKLRLETEGSGFGFGLWLGHLYLGSHWAKNCWQISIYTLFLITYTIKLLINTFKHILTWMLLCTPIIWLDKAYLWHKRVNQTSL